MSPRLRSLAQTVARRILHVLGKLVPGRPPRVLMYHSVDDVESPISVSPDLFRRQMDHLVAEGYVTWTASRFVEAVRDGAALPPRLAVITFDDGYVNNVTRALPILEERGLCATMFMVTRNAGETPKWGERDLARIRRQIGEDFRGGPAERAAVEAAVMATLRERLATWDELAPAPARGLEVLSHTRTHCFLDEASEEQLRDELAGSRADLREHGLGTPNSLAWPYGKYDEKAMAAAAAAGYAGAFLGEYYWELRALRDPWRIHRVGVDAQRGLFGFAFTLGRGYDLLAWVKRLYRRRRAK